MIKNVQQFRPDYQYQSVQYKVFLSICMVLAVLGLAVPWLPHDGKGDPTLDALMGLMVAGVFGYGAFALWGGLRRLPYVAVAADEDGIWYVHIGKEEGLVTWERIHGVKSRYYAGCLELLDCNNQVLLSVEYQLLGFERLRKKIFERSNAHKSRSDQSSFAVGSLHHVGFFAVVACFALVAAYMWEDENAVKAFAAVSLLGAAIVYLTYDYVVTATSIEITDDGFIVSYPFYKMDVLFRDVEDVVVIEYTGSYGRDFPQVNIMTKTAIKSVVLKGLGDVNDICIALRKAAKL